MPISFVILATISIIFGILIFFTDFYEKQHPRLNISLIAGISLAYFFLVLLPEISKQIPYFPIHLEFIEFLFVVIGFIFVHTSEKLILQRVESKSQRRMRKLIGKEKILQEVEENIENILTKELEKEEFDTEALKDITQTIADLHKQGGDYKKEIDRYKAKIQKIINEDLSKLRSFTHFTYHFLVGIIVVGLLAFDPFAGIFFFFYAWFRAIITYRSEGHIIFTDLDIYETSEAKVNKKRKYFLASASLIGVFIGLILDLFAFEYTGVFYILYSFISGVILYTIVREVLPEKEKGQPVYLLVGFIGFTAVIFAISIIKSLI